MTSPTPILYTIPNFITAGSGQALFEVVKRLDRRLFSPTICVLKTGGKLEDAIRAQDIPLLCLPFTISSRPLTSFPIRIWQAAHRFRTYKFALWHSYHYSDDYTESLIARAAGARAWIYTKKNMGWKGRAWRLRTQFASGIAAQNTAMINRFFTHPRMRAKTQLIPPGVDTAVYRPNVPPRLGIRQRFNLNAESLLIGCVAHLVPVKGHPTLIKALAAVPEAHLLLAGKALDETYARELKQLTEELDLQQRVHFLNNVDDVPALHSELDIFVLPTIGKGEGCPVALLEAMACGVASVVTDIPGSQDVVSSEHNGLIVPSENVDALAEALLKLKNAPELRSRLGNAARQHILSNYTIEHEVAQLEAMYMKVLRL